MEVILLQDVKSLGKKDEIVKLSDGYARNYILPKKLGIEATAANKNRLKLQKAGEERMNKQRLEEAKQLAEKINGSVIVILIKAGSNEKLFGSVSAKEIAAQVSKQLGIEVDKKKILLPEPIKTLGEHSVGIRLHRDVTATLTVRVEAS